MFENWVIIAVLAGVFSNLGSFFFRYLLKDGDDSTAYAWFYELMRLCIFSFIALFSFKLSVDIRSLTMLVILGILEFLAIFFMMKMHAFSHLSVSTIVLRTRLIWIPIIAFFLFHESLSLLEYSGIAILFFGLSIVTSPRKWLVDKGTTFAFIAAFATALVNIALKETSLVASISVAMVFMALPSVILFPLFMKNARKRIKTSLKTNFKLKFLSGIINAAAIYLLALAISFGSVSKVSAIYQGMMIVAVIAGIFILKEKENALRKIIGSVITILGVLLLTIK